MLRKVNKWWMGLDPAVQYMYWIISFCAMLMGGISLVLLMEVMFPTGITSLALVAAGITTFLGFFMFVVLFLAVIWPHYYKR